MRWRRREVCYQRSHRTVDATEMMIDAVERTEMDTRHAVLDDLLDG